MTAELSIETDSKSDISLIEEPAKDYTLLRSRCFKTGKHIVNHGFRTALVFGRNVIALSSDRWHSSNTGLSDLSIVRTCDTCLPNVSQWYDSLHSLILKVEHHVHDQSRFAL